MDENLEQNILEKENFDGIRNGMEFERKVS